MGGIKYSGGFFCRACQWTRWVRLSSHLLAGKAKITLCKHNTRKSQCRENQAYCFKSSQPDRYSFLASAVFEVHVEKLCFLPELLKCCWDSTGSAAPRRTVALHSCVTCSRHGLPARLRVSSRAEMVGKQSPGYELGELSQEAAKACSSSSQCCCFESF